jgi:hypothetical protein
MTTMRELWDRFAKHMESDDKFEIPKAAEALSPEQVLARAKRASELLHDPTLVEAMDGVEAALMLEWAQAPLADINGQHELRLMLEAARNYRKALQGFVNDGKIVLVKARHEEQSKRRQGRPIQV